MSKEDIQVNIFWVTDDYSERGVGYQYKDQITIQAIRGINSDIDWSKSMKDNDTQLYNKYNLDGSEIAFIESVIKPI